MIQSLASSPELSGREHQSRLEALTLLSEIKPAGFLPVDCIFTDFPAALSVESRSGIMNNAILLIRKKCEGLNEAANVEEQRKKFRSALNSGLKYEFSQGDLEEVQELINELRSEVGRCCDLDGGHKTRLLKRLEALQSELHKKISDRDKFCGLIGDAGIKIAKAEIDAKPIVDRGREIADIVWRTQTRAEGLPTGTTLR